MNGPSAKCYASYILRLNNLRICQGYAKTQKKYAWRIEVHNLKQLPIQQRWSILILGWFMPTLVLFPRKCLMAPVTLVKLYKVFDFWTNQLNLGRFVLYGYKIRNHVQQSSDFGWCDALTTHEWQRHNDRVNIQIIKGRHHTLTVRSICSYQIFSHIEGEVCKNM